MKIMQLPEKRIKLYIISVVVFTFCNMFGFMIGKLSTVGFIISALLMAYLIYCSVKNRNTADKGMGNWNWLFVFVMLYIFVASVYEIAYYVV